MKAVIFDMDGVLVDTSMLYAKAVRKAFKNRGYDFSIQYVKEKIIPHLYKWVESLLPPDAKNRGTQIEEMVAEIRKGIARMDEDFIVHEKSDILLGRLSRQMDLFIVTNGIKEITEKILEKNNIKNFFRKVIVSAADEFDSKEKAMEHLIKKFNLKTNDVTYVGDTRKDVLCARNIGCRVIILYTPFSWDYEKYDEIKNAKPDMIVKSFGNLVKVLEEG